MVICENMHCTSNKKQRGTFPKRNKNGTVHECHFTAHICMQAHAYKEVIMITGAELFVKALKAEQVDTLFAYPGDRRLTCSTPFTVKMI